MIIEQACTYDYLEWLTTNQHEFTDRDTTELYDQIVHDCPIVPAHCYTNVLNQAKYLKLIHGLDFDIVLTYGIRTTGNPSSPIWGYHYLLKASSGHYVDFQYHRYTFFPIHHWTLDEYEQEHEACETLLEFPYCSQIIDYYCQHNYKLILSMAYVLKEVTGLRTPSKKTIKDRVMAYRDGGEYWQPMWGKCLIQKMNA